MPRRFSTEGTSSSPLGASVSSSKPRQCASASRMHARALRRLKSRKAAPSRRNCRRLGLEQHQVPAPPRYHHYTVHALTSLPNVPALLLRAHGERRLRCHQHFTVATTSQRRTHRVIILVLHFPRYPTLCTRCAGTVHRRPTSRSTCGRSNESRQRQARRVRHAAGQRARPFNTGARRTRRRGRQERRRVLDGHGA